jgi:hypothetical protein
VPPLENKPEGPNELLLSYPDPPLTDGAVVLRRWAESDIGCVEDASREGRIPEGTTVPANFTMAEGMAWIERQWARLLFTPRTAGETGPEYVRTPGHSSSPPAH